MLLVNRNTVPGDKSAFRPGGIRVGTPALTSRNFKENDMGTVADLMDDCIKLAKKIEVSFSLPDKQTSLKDFKAVLGDAKWQEEIEVIRKKVEEFAIKFPMPGFPALE